MFEEFVPLKDKHEVTSVRNKSEAALKCTNSKSGLIVQMRFPTVEKLVGDTATFKILLNAEKSQVLLVPFELFDSFSPEAAVRFATSKSPSSAWIRLGTLKREKLDELANVGIHSASIRESFVKYEKKKVTDTGICHLFTISTSVYDALFGE